MNNIPEQYLIKDPSKLVKGQKLWSASFGDVVFRHIDASNKIVVLSEGEDIYHNMKGVLSNSDDKLPTLYLKSPFESQERVILVKLHFEFVPRVLIKFTEEGKPITWANAQTIEDSKKETVTATWNYWKELEPEVKEESILISDLKKLTIEEVNKLISK